MEVGTKVKALRLVYENIKLTLEKDVIYEISYINPLTPDSIQISLNGKAIKGISPKTKKKKIISFPKDNFEIIKIPSSYIYNKKTKFEKIDLHKFNQKYGSR